MSQTKVLKLACVNSQTVIAKPSFDEDEGDESSTLTKIIQNFVIKAQDISCQRQSKLSALRISLVALKRLAIVLVSSRILQSHVSKAITSNAMLMRHFLWLLKTLSLLFASYQIP